jgi:hypothetical protein
MKANGLSTGRSDAEERSLRKGFAKVLPKHFAVSQQPVSRIDPLEVDQDLVKIVGICIRFCDLVPENIRGVLYACVIVQVYIGERSACRIRSKCKLNIAGVVSRFEAILLTDRGPIVEELVKTTGNASIPLRKFSQGAKQFTVHDRVNTFAVVLVQHFLFDTLDVTNQRITIFQSVIEHLGA